MRTPDTITDEDIISLRGECEGGQSAADRELFAVCNSALNQHCHAARRHEAKQRCCDVLNARARLAHPPTVSDFLA